MPATPNKEKDNLFIPDWISPPGDTILDLLEERDWTRIQLSEHLGCTLEYLEQLIDGESSISKETALKLEQVLGSCTGFWLKRESQYRDMENKREKMNRLTREKVERIGYLYFNLTERFDDCIALTYNDASDIIWEFVQLLNLDCTRYKLNEIIHYWKQVEDIEEDCQLDIVCAYVFDGGLKLVPEEHELEPYFGGSLV